MAHVEIDEITPLISYTVGSTPTDEFTIPSTWGFFALTDFNVYVDGEEITYSASPSDAAEFSVAGNAADGGYQGGAVTLGAAVTSCVVTIERDVPTARTEDFPYPSPTVNIKALNTALDKIAAWAQQLKSKFNRTLTQPVGDADAIGELPDKATRASKYMAFDANGDPMATDGTGSTSPISAAMAAVVSAASLALARAALGATAIGEAIFTAANATAARLSLGLVIGTHVQAFSELLKDIAADITWAQGDILYYNGSALVNLGAGTNGQFLKTQGVGANPAWASAGLASGTKQNTTSGTAFNFTGIPSGTKQVTVVLDGISLNGTDNLLVQIGGSGGIETSAYEAVSGSASSSAGFIITAGADGNIVSGLLTLSLVDAATFEWVASGSTTVGSSSAVASAGRTTLDSELTQLRLTRSGSNSFDAGMVNIFYQ